VADTLLRGLRLFGLDVRGKTVLLKPNLVEYIPGAEVNTNPLLVAPAAEAFLELGAKSVTVAEGPGHQRDTYLVLAENGLETQLREQKLRFVDLNRDDVRQVKVTTPFTGSIRSGFRKAFWLRTSWCRCRRSKRTTGRASRSA
jgi:uncharacterized protein (DUF362 family)